MSSGVNEQTCAIHSQSDIDGNSNPDLALISCALATAHDQVMVYDGNDDMQWSSDWRIAADFAADTWIFDIGGNSRADLIIAFETRGQQLVAQIYDDRDGDGQVSYHVSGASVQITETADASFGAHPTVEAVAMDSWFLPDGRAQSNIAFRIDGEVPQQVSGAYPEVVRNYIKNDGSADFLVEVIDSDRNGDIDYQILRLMAAVPESYGLPRAIIFGREAGAGTRPPDGYWFWPFLGHSHHYELRNYLETPPTVDIDWATSRVRRVGIWGYPIEDGWHINSLRPLAANTISEANFENPMAYYDLANNKDGFPELHIRIQHQLPDDRHSDGAYYNVPNQTVRYSWKQNTASNLVWDYKLDLAGRHAIDHVVDLPGYSLRSIPYRSLAGWVTSRTWDAATFVAREGEGYASSEGIYEWPAVASSADLSYLLGLSVQPPTWPAETLPSGYRGEYSAQLHTRPFLYFSLMDRKLHLAKAQAGVWKLDNGRTIRYENLGGDYFNSWSLLEGGEPTKRVYSVSDYLIYADATTLELVQTDTAWVAFLTLPPRSHDEWAQLGAKLDEHPPTFPPDDFAAMIRQFSGSHYSITGASARDLRLTADGFRFVLSLQPAYRVQGTSGPNLDAVQPGEYVVTYDGNFAVEPLTPAEPRIVPGTLRLSSPAPVQLEAVQIEAIIENAGLEDWPNLRVQALAGRPGLPAVIITQTTVNLLGGAIVPVRFDWVPPAPGDWQIALSWGNDSDQASLPPLPRTAVLAVHVEEPPRLKPAEAWQLSNLAHTWLLVFMLAGVSLAAAALLGLTLRSHGIPM